MVGGCIEVLVPAMFGAFIIMTVYLPIFSLRGMEGKMFRPMAITVLLALFGAMVLSLTLMPAMASLLLGRKISEKESIIVKVVRRGYEPLLKRAMRWRWLTLVLALAVLIGSGITASRLGAEFVPRLDEGAIALQAWRLPSV